MMVEERSKGGRRLINQALGGLLAALLLLCAYAFSQSHYLQGIAAGEPIEASAIIARACLYAGLCSIIISCLAGLVGTIKLLSLRKQKATLLRKLPGFFLFLSFLTGFLISGFALFIMVYVEYVNGIDEHTSSAVRVLRPVHIDSSCTCVNIRSSTEFPYPGNSDAKFNCIVRDLPPISV